LFCHSNQNGCARRALFSRGTAHTGARSRAQDVSRDAKSTLNEGATPPSINIDAKLYREKNGGDIDRLFATVTHLASALQPAAGFFMTLVNGDKGAKDAFDKLEFLASATSNLDLQASHSSDKTMALQEAGTLRLKWVVERVKDPPADSK
jgi:hypothetical protein